jgi:hypothetical protein
MRELTELGCSDSFSASWHGRVFEKLFPMKRNHDGKGYSNFKVAILGSNFKVVILGSRVPTSYSFQSQRQV